MDSNKGKYIPALRYNRLTPIYDLFVRWTTRELTFKRRLVREAHTALGQRVLDLGCGTATLTILIKQAYPEAEVTGLDGDPRILEMARAKVGQAGLDITLDYGMAFELPYHDNSFDRVLSSLLFHHLTLENKGRTLKEVFRILSPGGELHIADFGRPSNALMYLVSLIVRRFEETSDNFKGLLPQIMADTGFTQVEELAQHMTMFGPFSFYRARKPE